MNRLMLALALLGAGGWNKPYPVPAPGEVIGQSKFTDLVRFEDKANSVICYQAFHADEVSSLAISCVKVKP